MDWKLFLTDYASYNNGTQFEFGHWIELDQFDDADEFLEYIEEHFADADEKSPLPCGTPREETMFTDYENLPETLYSESMSKEEIEKIFKLKEFIEENGLENLDNSNNNLVHLWNDYCDHNSYEDHIYDFDDDTLTMLLGTDPMKIFTAGLRAEINWSDDYITLNGSGNIESLNDPSKEIDETKLIDWILETQI